MKSSMNQKESWSRPSNATQVALGVEMKTKYRWHIVFALAFSWIAGYYVAWLPTFVEDSVINDYNFSSAEFSYIISMSYLGAAIGSFFGSFGIMSSNFNHILTLYCFLLLLFASNVFMIIIFYYYFDNEWMFIPYFWLLVIRFAIGICVGAIDTIISSMIDFWFEGNENTISLAFGILLTMLEVGTFLNLFFLVLVGTCFVFVVNLVCN